MTSSRQHRYAGMNNTMRASMEEEDIRWKNIKTLTTSTRFDGRLMTPAIGRLNTSYNGDRQRSMYWMDGRIVDKNHYWKKEEYKAYWGRLLSVHLN